MAPQYALHIDLGLDQLLLGVEVGRYPGRPSPLTAVALILLAAALATMDVRPGARARPPERLALAAALTVFVGVLSHLYGAGPLYRLSGGSVIGIAVPTNFALLLIAAGLLLDRPDAGLMRVVSSKGPGGMLLRRLVLPAVLALALLGVLVVRLFVALGVADFTLIAAAVTAATTFVGLLLVALVALALDRAHAELEASREHTRDLIDQASTDYREHLCSGDRRPTSVQLGA